MMLEPQTMTCEDVDELAGAYAVGALPADELDAVERHLRSCHRSDHAELGNLSETAALLPLLVPAAAPPADLGARITAAALLERAAEISGSAGESASTVVPFRARRPAALAFALAAAAIALVAIGLGAWGLGQRNALIVARQREQRQAPVLALLGTGGTVLQTPVTAKVPAALLVEPKGGGPAYLVQSWPALDRGKTYQAWYIAQGKPVSAGVFSGSQAELQAVQLAGPVQAAQAFAVTVEPAGGSAQPTSEPLFVRALAPG